MTRDPQDDRGGWWPDDEKKSDAAGDGTSDPDPDPPPKPPSPPRGLASREKRSKPAGRYSLVVGLVFVGIVLLAVFNLLGSSEDSGILGVNYGEEGLPLAEFAVPDALGSLEGDANVAQDDCETPRNPCSADQRRQPACAIDPEGAVRVCDFFDAPLALSFWFTRGGDCISTQDAFDRVAPRYEGRVNFLSINVRDERDTVAEIVREGGWEVPVGLDSDGAVSNLYRVGGCPTIAFAYPGGILYDAVIGDHTDEGIEDLVEGLLAASRERAERSR